MSERSPLSPASSTRRLFTEKGPPRGCGGPSAPWSGVGAETIPCRDLLRGNSAAAARATRHAHCCVRLPRAYGNLMFLHRLAVHLLLAVLDALYRTRVALARCHSRLERVFKVGHARRHAVRQYGPSAHSEDGCERSEDWWFLSQDVIFPVWIAGFVRSTCRSGDRACEDVLAPSFPVYVMCEAWGSVSMLCQSKVADIAISAIFRGCDDMATCVSADGRWR